LLSAALDSFRARYENDLQTINAEIASVRGSIVQLEADLAATTGTAQIRHLRRDLAQRTRMCYHCSSSPSSVLACGEEAFARSPRRESEHFSAPLTLPAKRAAEHCIPGCSVASPTSIEPGQGYCDHTLRRSVLRLLTVHRILIASGIAVCLLYAGREIANYTHTHSAAPLLHAALSVAAAAALALYLRSIRTL
jgi:hypothetical protein